jgi:glycosyltransferase involved in cell wall biosynthesis
MDEKCMGINFGGTEIMNNHPRVSVIITTYNRCELLKRALNSVLDQTYSNFECIVVDDASTDETSQVVAEFNDDRIIYIKHKENKHLSAARNTGIHASNGEFIAFLDDDDEWYPRKLEKQVKLLKDSENEVGLVYCWMNYYKNSGEKVNERHPNLRGHIFSQVLVSQPLGNGSTYLIRRKAINHTGYFDESLKRGIDGDYIRRLCYKYKVDYVPEVLIKYYVDHGNKRITRDDKKGIDQNITGQRAKLKKFSFIEKKYPKQYSSILANIAFSQCKLGDYKESINTFAKALQAYPFNTDLYSKIMASLKTLLSKNDGK